MDRIEALEIFDGVMVSDGGLVMNGLSAYFDMKQSDKHHTVDHSDWLYNIRDALRMLGADIYPENLKPFEVHSAHGVITGHRLTTRCSFFLHLQRLRWYNRNHKEVPEDFRVTPLALADWFMGDGNSHWYKHDNKAVSIYLCTQGYSLGSVGILQMGLEELGLRLGQGKAPVIKGAGVVITILQESVNRFMDIVEPYTVPSYMYKIKRRR